MERVETSGFGSLALKTITEYSEPKEETDRRHHLTCTRISARRVPPRGRLCLVSPARPDYVAHERATRATFSEVLTLLREILGARLCAYLGSVKETRAVNEWAAGTREPSEATQQRLRVALRVALAIADVDSPEITRAWFQGLNPQLDERSPARLLREGDLDEVGPAVVAAARAFLVGG